MRVGMELERFGAALTAQARTWRGSWAAAPTPPLMADQAGPEEAEWVTPEIEGRTIVQQLRLSAGGTRLRLRFTNEYGSQPLIIGQAHVELLAPSGQPAEDQSKSISFSGSPTAMISAGAPLVSDPVAITAPPLSTLRVSLYLPGAAALCSCHADGGDFTRISPVGNFVDRPFVEEMTTQVRPYLSRVDVESDAAAPVIVTFGDSITDGYLSSVGQNRRWPDRLAERLASDPALGNAAVVNSGISGNRLLSDDAIPIFGKNGLARFDRDVLAVPSVSHLIVLIGINDICTQPGLDADALIAGFRQIIGRAHAHHIKVILGTVMPFGGTPYFTAQGDATRQILNCWIRTQKEADAIIDFDSVMRDPADPVHLKEQLQPGDWIHPNDAGYRLMGESVPLDLFR